MADEETEAEWARLRRIEEERKKAEQAINEGKPELANRAYLDPQKEKVRGWSSNQDLLLKKAEKYGAWGLILSIAGVVLGIISLAGSVISSIGSYGLGGLIISGIPGGIGGICLLAGAFFGIIATVVALYYRFKNGKKIGTPGWSGISTLLVIAGYLLIRWLIFRM